MKTLSSTDDLRKTLRKKTAMENDLRQCKRSITTYLVRSQMNDFFKVDWNKLNKYFTDDTETETKMVEV